MRVAVDAGPLIHLAEVGALTLLQMFDTLYIPDAVWSETVGVGRLLEAQVIGLGNSERSTLPPSEMSQFVQSHHLERLQAGECECLCLCQRLGLSTLLTDDLDARDAARRLDLVPVGSLGIVMRAYRMRNLSLADAERYMMQLYEVSSLFVTRTLVELAVDELRQHAASEEM
jgi:predicted nucleic acid-binding protein